MSWGSLCGDLQRDILGLVSEEAACYFVSTEWRAWLCQGMSPDLEYWFLVEAGLRIALARGQGTYYTGVLAEYGRRLLGSGQKVPPRGQLMYPETEDPVPLFCFDEPAPDPAGSARIVAPELVPVFPCYDSPEYATRSADFLESAGVFALLTEVHDAFLLAGRWPNVAGPVSTDMASPSAVCLIAGEARTETRSPGLLAESRANEPLYPQPARIPRVLDDPEWLATFKTDRGKWKPQLSPEELAGTFDRARREFHVERIPGKTVTECADDAFHSDDVHEMLKLLLAQDLDSEWDDEDAAAPGGRDDDEGRGNADEWGAPLDGWWATEVWNLEDDDDPGAGTRGRAVYKQYVSSDPDTF